MVQFCDCSRMRRARLSDKTVVPQAERDSRRSLSVSQSLQCPFADAVGRDESALQNNRGVGEGVMNSAGGHQNSRDGDHYGQRKYQESEGLAVGHQLATSWSQPDKYFSTDQSGSQRGSTTAWAKDAGEAPGRPVTAVAGFLNPNRSTAHVSEGGDANEGRQGDARSLPSNRLNEREMATRSLQVLHSRRAC